MQEALGLFLLSSIFGVVHDLWTKDGSRRCFIGTLRIEKPNIPKCRQGLAARPTSVHGELPEQCKGAKLFDDGGCRDSPPSNAFLFVTFSYVRLNRVNRDACHLLPRADDTL